MDEENKKIRIKEDLKITMCAGKKKWNNSENDPFTSLVKGSIVGGAVLFTGLSAILHQYYSYPLPTNETYEQTIDLRQKIRMLENKSVYDISISTNAQDITTDLVNHIAFINTKKDSLENMINTPEYKTVIKAQEDKNKFIKNYLKGIVFLSGISFASGAYGAFKNYKKIMRDLGK